MKKKTMVLATALIWCVIGIVLIGTILFFAAKGVPDLDFQNRGTVLLKEETVDVSGLTDIRIDCDSQNISVSPSPDGMIHARIYGSERSASYESYDMRRDGSKWTLTCNSRGWSFLNFFSWFNPTRVELQLPQSFEPVVYVGATSSNVQISGDWQWADTEIHVSSGSIDIDGDIGSAQSIAIQCTSGRIHTESLRSLKSISLKGTSGNMRAQRLQSEQVTLDTTSGRIDVREIIARTYDIQNTSGTITVDALSGGGQVECSSGSIKCNLTRDIQSSSFKCSSGNITIGVPEGLSFNYTCDSTSGSVRGSALQGTNSGSVQQDNGVTLTMKTTSGNISVDNYTP